MSTYVCEQGLGLFASRDLERHTMVIEYIGALIRSEVAESRERIYEEQVSTAHGHLSFKLGSFPIEVT